MCCLIRASHVIRKLSLLCVLVACRAGAADIVVASVSELKSALRAAVPGSVILVQPGTYLDPESNWETAFNPDRSGTSELPITIRSAVEHQAVLQSRVTASSPKAMAPAIGIRSRSYVVVEGFRVEGGIAARDSSHVTIRNCDVTGGYIESTDQSLHWGIVVLGSDHCLVENNSVHDMDVYGIGNHEHNTACIMIFGSSDNLVQNNEVDATSKYVYSGFGQKGGAIHRNVWRRNVARGAVTGFLGMGSTDETAFSTENDFYENIVLDSDYFLFLDHNCTGFRAYNNTAHRVRTFVYGGYDAVRFRNSGLESWNNLVSCDRGYLIPNSQGSTMFDDLLAYSDHNAYAGAVGAWWEGNSTYDLSGWRTALPLDGSSQTGPISFAGVGTEDFHLPVGSPAVHAGENRNGLSPGYDGGAPDLGAYPRNDATVIGLGGGAGPDDPGRGGDPEPEGPGQDDQDVSTGGTGASGGCQSGGAGAAGGAWVLASLGLGALRRRRSPHVSSSSRRSGR